ncbi:hypothetical protein KIN20_029058 [Parelaphostrongylus tenuis]|uniref:ZP domain-containing protein n=1 Tax=Parelaphostrongylus tenuis TaxID=148309 RepID=A0AAD5R1T5_PARTN|nr:hypothetical protein KIN20_029058 [Parelaphostrongylus tenuis]
MCVALLASYDAQSLTTLAQQLRVYLVFCPYEPRVRGATDITCDEHSVSLTVRTQRPMNGLMYAQNFHDNSRCFLVTNGASREASLTFHEGECGLSKTPSQNRDGYYFNITVILQFHPLILTRADQGLDVKCFYPQMLTPQKMIPVPKRVWATQPAPIASTGTVHRNVSHWMPRSGKLYTINGSVTVLHNSNTSSITAA